MVARADGPEGWLDDVRDAGGPPPKRFSSLLGEQTEEMEAAEDAALATFLSELDASKSAPRAQSSAPERRSRGARSAKPSSSRRAAKRTLRACSSRYVHT